MFLRLLPRLPSRTSTRCRRRAHVRAATAKSRGGVWTGSSSPAARASSARTSRTSCSRAGYRVRVARQPVAAGPRRARGGPTYLDAEVELIVGDVRDREAVRRALEGVDAVVHLAARVGVGQSMYEIARVRRREQRSAPRSCSRRCSTSRCGSCVVASSMSVYGEGSYATRGGAAAARGRDARAARGAASGSRAARDGEPLTPVADARDEAAGARVGLRARRSTTRSGCA